MRVIVIICFVSCPCDLISFVSILDFLNPQLLAQLSLRLRLVPSLVEPNSIVLRPGFVSASIPIRVFYPESYNCLFILFLWYPTPVP